MSSRVFVPFDNNPTSVSVKTASYTIPAGKYAKVYVECDSGGQFTINGSVAVDTDPFLNIDVFRETNGTISYTVPTGYNATVQFSNISSVDEPIVINGNTNTFLGMDFGNPYEIIKLGPGGSLSVTTNSDIKSITGSAIPSNATHRQAEFFLPSGTVISGSGNWKATVMEYNAVT